MTDNFRNTGFFNDTTLTVQAPLSDPTISVPVTFRQSATDADNHGTATIAAVYLQDQIEFSEHFQAILGLRFDQFDMDFRNNRTATDLDSSDDLLSPRAGLIYKPIEPVSIYASYSMTYVPRAGAQLASLNPTNEALDPEEFENIELGAKWDLNENLALTAAVFQLERTNVVIPNPTDPTLSILVKGQTNKGVELGVTGRISDAWSVEGGYAFQDGELTSAARRPAPGPASRARVLPVEQVRLQLAVERRPRPHPPDGNVRRRRQCRDTAVVHARRCRSLLLAEPALARASERREPARRELLRERQQQQQHHAGFAARGARGRDGEFLAAILSRREPLSVRLAACNAFKVAGGWGRGAVSTRSTLRAGSAGS